MTKARIRGGKPLRVGAFSFYPAAGDLTDGEGNSRRLEPKVASLLTLLAERAGEVLSRDEISQVLWPDVTVGDDALPRSVSKLRRAFGDDPKQARYVETVPKRGYRLVAPVAPVAPAPGLSETKPAVEESVAEFSGGDLGSEAPRRNGERVRRATTLLLLLSLALAIYLWRSEDPAPTPNSAASEGQAAHLVERADDFYIHITRQGNESAIELYEQALAVDPEFSRAHAGLANALVQRVLRYPRSETPELDPVNLGSALASGRLQTPEARHHLERAMGLAERAVRLDPENAASHKALGFVSSALGRLEDAEEIYQEAIAIDPDAWDVLINLGDIHEIRGLGPEALVFFERAYQAMERVYAEQPQRVSPWLAELGASIGDRHVAAGRSGEAEIWYRRVLGYAPLHPQATCELAKILRAAGDPAAAGRLENQLAERLGEENRCPASPRSAEP